MCADWRLNKFSNGCEAAYFKSANLLIKPIWLSLQAGVVTLYHTLPLGGAWHVSVPVSPWNGSCSAFWHPQGAPSQPISPLLGLLILYYCTNSLKHRSFARQYHTILNFLLINIYRRLISATLTHCHLSPQFSSFSFPTCRLLQVA